MSETRAKGVTTKRKERPMLSPDAYESRLISKAMNEAEYQIDSHTASSQVLTHFLKLGSSLAELEKEKLKNENAVLSAKAEAIKSGKASEELYSKALEAMRSYSGHGGDSND